MNSENSALTPVSISVILPVYNVAPWIGKCIDSLKKQTLPGLEFIFVEDCSADDSLSILEAFAREDKRVRILRNDANIGAGPSRNRGIEAARGEYLSFIDPDDWISDDFYELLYARARETGCQVVKGTRVRVHSGKANVSEVKTNRQIEKKLRRGTALFALFRTAHQTAIYKNNLFRDSRIRYASSKLGEDSTFLIKILYDGPSIAFEHHALYFYLHREGSATAEFSLERSLIQLDSVAERIEFFNTKTFSRDQITYLFFHLAYNLSRYYTAVRAEAIPRNKQEEYRNKMTDTLSLYPSAPLLLKSLPELDIFVNYNYLIPLRNNTKDPVFTECLSCWTDFFSDYPRARSRSYCRGYASAMIRCMLSFREDRGKKKRGSIFMLRFIKSQLARLSVKDRRRVLLPVPSILFFALLGKAGLIRQRAGV